MNKICKTPHEAADFLAKSQLATGYQHEALHEYTDKDGKALYWRIRLKHPETNDKWIRPMQLTQKGYTLKEPPYPEGKPLYRLHELVSRPQEPVIICEGELCADTLATLGLLATTSGSAESAGNANWQPLAGRNVLLWPDNDEAGRRYVTIVASHLKKLNCKLQLIDINGLNLPPKGDVVNWLAANSTATKETILSLPTINSDTLPVDSTSNTTEADEDEKYPNQASLLVKWVTEQAELFHDKNKRAYAQDKKTLETRRLDSQAFKDWLLSHFYNNTHKVVREQSVREALNILTGLARYQGNCYDVFVRVAQHEEAYYIDLAEPGQSRAIEIKAGKWTLVSAPPVHFLRSESMRPLPEPLPGGELSRLWELVNIPEQARLLCTTWLAECWRPETPFPLLELIGEQGSAKSTTQAILRQLIDPNGANLRAAPQNCEDVFISAGMNWVISYENISHLPAALQDALCVISTGGAHAKRKLYSDAEESLIVTKRPIVLNGISPAITAQDLVDRTISIELPIITSRVTTNSLQTAFQAAQGHILGGLLDIMAQALTRLPSINLPLNERPRLLEFTQLGCAIAEVMGETEQDFLAQFNTTRAEAITRTLDASPAACALRDWFEAKGQYAYILTTKELFDKIEGYKPRHTDAWPRSAKGFGDALRRAAPALRHIGIECRYIGKTGGHVKWEIKPRE